MADAEAAGEGEEGGEGEDADGTADSSAAADNGAADAGDAAATAMNGDGAMRRLQGVARSCARGRMGEGGEVEYARR